MKKFSFCDQRKKNLSLDNDLIRRSKTVLKKRAQRNPRIYTRQSEMKINGEIDYSFSNRASKEFRRPSFFCLYSCRSALIVMNHMAYAETRAFIQSCPSVSSRPFTVASAHVTDFLQNNFVPIFTNPNTHIYFERSPADGKLKQTLSDILLSVNTNQFKYRTRIKEIAHNHLPY